MEKSPALADRPFKRKRWNDLYQQRLQSFDELKSIDVETKNDLHDIVVPLLKKSVEAERESFLMIESSLLFFLGLSFFVIITSILPLYSFIVNYIFLKAWFKTSLNRCDKWQKN